MNNSTLIGGLVAIVVIAVLALFVINGGNFSPSNVTSTGSTIDTDQDNSNGGDVQAGPPVATTNSSVAPTDTTAVVSGTVVPNGASTAYWYEYGTTASLGKKTSNQSVGTGYGAIPSPGYITGLAKNTTYYFRLVAENQYGRDNGDTRTFVTSEGTPAPVGGLPTSKTLAANGIARTSANLKGEVNPNRATTQYWFEYGANGNLGNTTSFTSVGSGSALISASTAISNLAPATTYYYRLNAQNQFGTVNGAILTFKTSGPPAAIAPVVTTQQPSPVATTNVTVRGTVNPNGFETKYWFEYSTDSLLGSLLLKTTAKKSAGGDTGVVSVETSISGLKSETNYYYRIVAENNGGTVRGDTITFKTK